MSDRIVDQWSDSTGDYYVTTSGPYKITGICHCGHTEVLEARNQKNARLIGQWILNCTHHDCPNYPPHNTH